MLPSSRGRRRGQNIEDDSAVEATSPKPARQDTTQPDLEQGINQEDASNNDEDAFEPASAGDQPHEWPDPFTVGQGKPAQFWSVYVRETDAYDKGLAEGWNNMLEVILIFAALFSVISTAFVLESLKGLKPDPAESAAATLLLISQTLFSLSNQQNPSPVVATPESVPFVPSGSAVAVNVLWFTSLILSVSVMLVAMLAKEWLHLFIVGRTGTPLERARERQKRFEGMKAWKMSGVITALPALMHLALFLFAAGLCVYLWDIHQGVAVPVVVVTLLIALVYVAALVLPLIYDYCPYATALSRLIKPYPEAWSRKREAQRDHGLSSSMV
ncbi:hypothetical protein BDV93DRAFT_113769 [Ceratobasidium sp. AG-I]|nr:hypothetical protein BDV93DRAFT_113769 [Ceratobasidium sp. AG-I]